MLAAGGLIFWRTLSIEFKFFCDWFWVELGCMPINYVYINFKQPQILICSITFELYACIKFLKLALSFLASYIQILSNLIYKPKNTKTKYMQSNTTSSFTVEEWYNEMK